MRTIFKIPLLKLGSRELAVEDVQAQLNFLQKANPIWTKTKPLEVDGKYGPFTEGKAREFQKSAALLPDGIVGPATRAVLFAPQADRVDQAQGIATNWAFLARAGAQTLRAHVQALQFNRSSPAGNLPLLLDALRTHFHIDLAGGSGSSGRRPGGSLNPLDLLTIDDPLSFVNQVYEDALFVLLNASIREGRVFYSMGFRESDDRGLLG